PGDRVRRLGSQRFSDLLKFGDNLGLKQRRPTIEEDFFLGTVPFEVMSEVHGDIEAARNLVELSLLMPDRQLLGNTLQRRVGPEMPAARLERTLQPTGA